MSETNTTSGIGHNEFTHAIRKYVERVERLDTEIVELNTDKREVYAEAKTQGLDVKVLKRVIQRRRQDRSAQTEMDELLAIYERALEGGV